MEDFDDQNNRFRCGMAMAMAFGLKIVFTVPKKTAAAFKGAAAGRTAVAGDPGFNQHQEMQPTGNRHTVDGGNQLYHILSNFYSIVG